MAKILVAETKANGSYVQKVLAPAHELNVVTTMQEAATELNLHKFDVILIDLYFDESRMFDAMQLVKATSQNATTPMICVGGSSERLPRVAHDGLEFATRAMGAWMFIDLDRYKKADAPELLRIVDRCLIGEARKATHQVRAGLAEQRAEIHRLRLEIEHQEWSEELEHKLTEMRQRLTGLLVEICDLHMGNISQQDQIDEYRDLKDRVSEAVVNEENKATRAERAQTRGELSNTVVEYELANREGNARKERGDAAPNGNTNSEAADKAGKRQGR